MNDATSKEYNENVEGINAIVASDNSAIDYCKCSDANYTVQISEENKAEGKEQGKILDTKSPKIEDKIFSNGEIIITSILDCGEHEYLEGVKINLYKINGLSPVLIKSKVTDEKGKVVFSGIEEGCYRIIEIVDKRYFEKPKYINWNEIIIDSVNANQKIIIVNRIKGLTSQDKHRHLV